MTSRLMLPSVHEIEWHRACPGWAYICTTCHICSHAGIQQGEGPTLLCLPHECLCSLKHVCLRLPVVCLAKHGRAGHACRACRQSLKQAAASKPSPARSTWGHWAAAFRRFWGLEQCNRQLRFPVKHWIYKAGHGKAEALQPVTSAHPDNSISKSLQHQASGGVKQGSPALCAISTARAAMMTDAAIQALLNGTFSPQVLHFTYCSGLWWNHSCWQATVPTQTTVCRSSYLQSWSSARCAVPTWLAGNGVHA